MRFLRLPLFCLAAGAALCFLLPFLYAFCFCYPRGDDYDGITRSMFLFDLPGGLYETGREWLTWSGRYVYHFLAVFLGKAAANPISYGLVCLAILMAFPLAFFQLFRLAGLGKRDGFLSALFGLCALLACHGNLGDFYLLTDTLTIVLQAGLYLLFLASALGLCLARDPSEIRRQGRICAALGVLAVGVYEHAALAALWTMAACFAASFLAPLKLSGAGQRIRNSLAPLLPWLAGALLFSFLAPGNFLRQSARNVDLGRQTAQLADAPAQLLRLAENFVFSSWPWAVICLIALARLRFRPIPGSAGASLSMLSIIAFILFSLSLSVLHALSDAPLGSAAKLGASLEIYAALTLALCLFFLLPRQPARGLSRGIYFAFFASGLALALFNSANFQKTSINAASGLMLEYGDFMSGREERLARIAAGADSRHDKFGLIGEILNPEARERKVRPEDGEAVIQSFPLQVFPVHMGLGLDRDPAGWPNLWAAWAYGLGSIMELPPDPFAAIAAVRNGAGERLALAGESLLSELSGAWLLREADYRNPALCGVWLVLSASRPLTARILLPSPPDRARLLPFFIQEKVYEAFKRESSCQEKFFTPFCAREAGISIEKNWGAFWLGPPRPGRFYIIFASFGGIMYEKISENENPLEDGP